MVSPQTGMSLRDYFAAAALQAMLTGSLFQHSGVVGVNGFEFRIAEDAYKLSDAMLAERDK